MKKVVKLLLVSSILISSQVNAVCSVLAHATDKQIAGDVLSTLSERHDFNITNQTGTTQTYQVCHEYSTQNYAHKEKFTNAYCESITLNAGQSTGTVYRWLELSLKYPHNPQGWLKYNIYSIIEINGECHALTHLIKTLKVV